MTTRRSFLAALGALVGAPLVAKAAPRWPDKPWYIHNSRVKDYATGRLLPGDNWLACDEPTRQRRPGENEWPYGMGPTPLIAVCNLLLALHAAGKLEPRA